MFHPTCGSQFVLEVFFSKQRNKVIIIRSSNWPWAYYSWQTIQTWSKVLMAKYLDAKWLFVVKHQVQVFLKDVDHIMSNCLHYAHWAVSSDWSAIISSALAVDWLTVEALQCTHYLHWQIVTVQLSSIHTHAEQCLVWDCIVSHTLEQVMNFCMLCWTCLPLKWSMPISLRPVSACLGKSCIYWSFT